MQASSAERHIVLAVAGPAGSGKSTLGRALARRTGAVILDQDVATNPLMAEVAKLVGAGDDLDHSGLRGTVRRARYQCVIDTAADNVGIGRDVVMVAPFTSECGDPVSWAQLERRLRPAEVVLVWVSVTPEVALARRLARNCARDRKVVLADGPLEFAIPAVPFLPASGSARPDAEADRIVGALRDALSVRGGGAEH